MNTQSLKTCNLDYLLELAKGNKAFIEEMLGIFIAENPIEIQQVEKGISEMDFGLIKSSAHKMKSTIPFVGLDKLIKHELQEIENLAASKSDLEKIKVIFAKVKETCLKAQEELKA
jgi:HPt (histidine-containing phosphotransfer) domain-containing protein